MASGPAASNAYLLGSASPERQRLALQHRIWRGSTEELWQRAGIGPGARVVDLGSGPGDAALDLAERVGADGRVLAWDRSEEALADLQRRLDAAAADATEGRNAQLAPAPACAPIALHAADAVPPLPEELRGAFDFVFARWMLCWLSDPGRSLALARELLRPGGRVVVLDYLHYESIEWLPRRPALRRGVQAVKAAWRDSGGDPNFGRRLPALLEDGGFRLVDVRKEARVATTGDALWDWPASFFPVFLAQIAADGHLSGDEVDAFLAAFDETRRDPHGLFVAPAMIFAVAERA